MASREEVTRTIIYAAATLSCACSRPVQLASSPAPTPPCTAALLKHAPRFDTTKAIRLAGRYEWVGVDTVSNRRRVRGMPDSIAHVVFRLWLTDSTYQAPLHQPTLGHPNVGALSGAIEGFDQTGFTPDYPQIQLKRGYLQILYDAKIMMDGGYRMDNVPIDVVDAWGFGGYYDNNGVGILAMDETGYVIPPLRGITARSASRRDGYRPFHSDEELVRMIRAYSLMAPRRIP